MRERQGGGSCTWHAPPAGRQTSGRTVRLPGPPGALGSPRCQRRGHLSPLVPLAEELGLLLPHSHVLQALHPLPTGTAQRQEATARVGGTTRVSAPHSPLRPRPPAPAALARGQTRAGLSGSRGVEQSRGGRTRWLGHPETK